MSENINSALALLYTQIEYYMCIDSVNAFFGINMPLSRSTICFCRRQYSQSLFVSGFNAVYILPPRFYFFFMVALFWRTHAASNR